MRRNDFLVFIFMTILIVISLAYWLSYIEIPKYSKRFIRLENVDKEKYDYVKKIADNPLFKKRETEFYVSYIDLVSTVDRINGNVYLSFQDLRGPCLNYIVYHELGHLQEVGVADEIKADYFSVLILGPDKTYGCLEGTFNRLKFKMHWSGRLQIYSRLFAIKNRFTSELEAEEHFRNKLLKE